nr:hypothetical protein [uncultured Desulfobulbus sp.]
MPPLTLDFSILNVGHRFDRPVCTPREAQSWQKVLAAPHSRQSNYI